MTEPLSASFSARAVVDRLRTQLELEQASADTQATILRHLQDRAAAGRSTAAQVDAAAGQHATLQQAADNTRSSLSSVEQTLVEALDAEDKLFTDHNTDPIALLPVRLETVWWDAQSLRVRVYPDDMHVAQLDPGLTPLEAQAGAQYWQGPGPEAWQQLLTTVRPNRAAWAAHAMRPGAPPPVIRDDNPTRRQRTVTMPHHWRFIGLVDGEVVIDKNGRPIPNPLPLNLLDDDKSWTVHWFQAVKAGMAVELEFHEGLDHLDELLVVGVGTDPASAGAEQLADLLRGHVFGAGLTMLKPGTPTNNTPNSRSGWSSRPTYAPPTPDPDAGDSPAADTLTRALDLPDAALLRTCSGATDPELDALTGLTLFTWAALGRGFSEAAVTHHNLNDSSLNAFDAIAPWRDIRDHLIEHVRSRGPLPMLRVGRQPYAVLPASSLTDWRAERADAPDTRLLPWLLRLREKWREVLGTIPHIGQLEPDVNTDNKSVDEVMVDMLSRQAGATGLAMRRLDGPGFAVPKTGPEEAPSFLSLAGLPPDSTLRWTSRSDAWTDMGTDSEPPKDLPDFVIRMTQGHEGFTTAAAATADYLHAIQAFLAGHLSAQDYDQAWPVLRGDDSEQRPRRVTFFGMPDGSGLLEAVVSVRNSAFLELDGDALGTALTLSDTVDQIVADILDDASDGRDEIREAAKSSATLARIEQLLRAIAAVPVTRIAELLLEVIDVYSHRVDAWVTSLASRRLGEMRAAGVRGVRVGGYGWVENVHPPQPHDVQNIGDDELPAIRDSSKGYIHAPSLQHATAAAVLRSGSMTHPGENTYSINLNSRRARIARWLIGGVRQGQNLGALLGYRFERALHDANLDTEIANFRKKYPTPVVAEPPATDAPNDLWAHSSEVIAARNVIDGVALARDTSALSAASLPTKVAPILAELTDALDAVGDLLLAESVYQLVGGNPVRAGLAADTLGRGADVPDTFDTLITPHRARALTNRLAVVLPDAPIAPTGWATDAVSRLAPGIDAWVPHLLGPAAGWTVAGTAGDDQLIEHSLDTLGMSALATILDISGSEPAGLRRAFLAASGLPADTTMTFGGNDWKGLHGMAVRIRSLLAEGQPILPGHLPGGDERAVDVTDVRQRLAAFAADPVIAQHPRAAALAAVAAKAPEDAPQEKPADWLQRPRSALADVLGADLPLVPRVTGPPPAARSDAVTSELDAWLLRYTRVRGVARTMHETLLLAGARAQRTETLFAAQDPVDTTDTWVGGVFGADTRPMATTHLVWHQPFEPAGAVTGLVVDEWVELLPGADRLRRAAAGSPAVTSPPESELTGIAFHYDRPDAKAPHSIILAVPPDLDRGWTPDGLVQVLRETLEWAKLRAVDINDLPLMGALLPAIRIAQDSAAGVVLAGMETQRPNSDPAGPFRLEPDHRTRDRVDAGLAARVHDPLWLLTRQWQFGEFAAQDAGSPAWVSFNGSSALIDAWRPAGTEDWLSYSPTATPLDVVVEAEPVRIDKRLRAEGGAHLVHMLDEAGQLTAAAGGLEDLLLPDDQVDDSVVGLLRALGGHVPDAHAVAKAIDDTTFGAGLGGVPARWRHWWSDVLADHSPDCFDPHHIEHEAELSTRGAVLRISEYRADGLDWYCADVDTDTDAAPAGSPYTFADEALPSPVRYGGIPADRFWEMEDSEVDLGATDASTLDTGRLLLISFATVYGNDWFLAPLEVPSGSLTVLDRMLVRDVFDRQHFIERAGHDDPTWSMFTLASPDPDHPAASGLLMMPAAQPHTGELLERVGVARDELANLVWAVQHSYTDDRGERVDRRDRWLREAPPPVAAGELPAYGVQTIVPNYWFPLVPRMVRPEVVHFHLADMNAAGHNEPPEDLADMNAAGHNEPPEGRLIPADLWLHEEEVPREGIVMSRQPVLSRWFDGSWHSWIRRQKAPGTGESSSGLAFDTVRPSGPWTE